MKIKSGFVVQKVGGKYLAVAVGEMANDFNALVRMNETGMFMWNKLSEADLSEEELLDLLLEEYEVDVERARADIGAFVEKLRSVGLFNE